MNSHFVKENRMTRKNPYSVPEGYFESLNKRLSAIPQEQSSGKSIHLAPYFALAAMFAVAVILGNVFVQQSEPAAASASDEEIIEYLIESGVTLAQLEETVNY